MQKTQKTKKHKKHKKQKNTKKNKLSEARGAQPATTGRNRVRLPTERRALKVCRVEAQRVLL